MTKQILKYMALVAIMEVSSFAFISCNDEDETKMDKQTVVGTQKAALPPTYTVREFHRDNIGGVDSIWCDNNHPGNCLPEVVITSTILSNVISDFRRSIDYNTHLIYIERNRTVLEQYFRSDDLDGAINGELTVSYQQRYKTFFMFTNVRTGEVVGAYPFGISE